jgi:hypothetical protein
MRGSSVYKRSIMAIASAVTALMMIMAPIAVQADGNPNLRVLPPNSRAFGLTYGGWSAAWWQYVESQPASSNPLSDVTGERCGVAQSGPVFFLVGTNGSGQATRETGVKSPDVWGFGGAAP